jgi:RimJ/RimL family protein N-acetyltransferase
VDEIDFPIGGIDDGVVRLRLHTDADLRTLVAGSLDPEVVRWTRIPENNTIAQTGEFLAAARRPGADELHLVVCDAETDEVLGSVGMVSMDRTEGRCDLGYWLAAPARGRGLMTRSLALLSRWILDNLPVDRLGIEIEPANVASRAVAERCGFTFEGVLRSYFVNKGRRRDAAIYSLLRDEAGALPGHRRREGRR